MQLQSNLYNVAFG